MTKLNASKLEHITQESFNTKIPFYYNNGSIFIEVKIDGKRKYFILDSGSGTLIDQKLCNTLDYKLLGTTKYKDASGKKNKLKNIQIEELEIGGVKFNKVIASIANFEAISKKYPCFKYEISGIVGYNILSKAVWEFNFSQQDIILSDKRATKNKTNSFVFYFDDTNLSRPILDLKIGNISVGKTLLDFGSNASIAIPENYFSLINNLYNVKTLLGNKSAFNSESSIVKVKIADSENTSINGYEILNTTKLLFESELIKPLIGTRFLENYDVTLDGPNRLILLNELASNKLKKRHNNAYEITFFLYDDELRVSSVVEESLAFNKGIRCNDKVLSINNIDLFPLSNQKYCNFLKVDFNELDSLKIRLEKGKNIVDLRLPK